MDKLELKKLKVELLRIEANIGDRELVIEEKLAEIQRIEEHLEISKTRKQELLEKLKTMEGNNK